MAVAFRGSCPLLGGRLARSGLGGIGVEFLLEFARPDMGIGQGARTLVRQTAARVTGGRQRTGPLPHAIVRHMLLSGHSVVIGAAQLASGNSSAVASCATSSLAGRWCSPCTPRPIHRSASASTSRRGCRFPPRQPTVSPGRRTTRRRGQPRVAWVQRACRNRPRWSNGLAKPSARTCGWSSGRCDCSTGAQWMRSSPRAWVRSGRLRDAHQSCMRSLFGAVRSSRDKSVSTGRPRRRSWSHRGSRSPSRTEVVRPRHHRSSQPVARPRKWPDVAQA